MPYERVVQEVNPNRDLSQLPLFQVVFIYNPRRSGLQLTGVDVRDLPVPVTHTRADLELYVSERGDGFDCQIVYNTDLLEASTVTRLAEHFQELLASIARDPYHQGVAAGAAE